MMTDLLSRLLPHRSPPVLICESDGYRLRGAVVLREAGGVRVLCHAQSGAAQLEQAVAELTARVQAAGARATRARLLMPGVVTALLELPVDPKKPRPLEQMEDLVRWEMEPLMMQQATLWSEAHMLAGLGHLDAAQVRAIEQQQRERRPPDGIAAPGGYGYKSFGEVALDLGYLTRAQLDECQARLAWVKGGGDALACNWVAQPLPPAAEAEAEPDSDAIGQPWLVSAVSRALLQRWQAAFAAQGIRLQALYPLVGCAAALAEADTDALVLEPHAGTIVGIRLQHGAVTLWHAHHGAAVAPLDACLETYHAVTPPEPEMLWLAHDSAPDDALPATLTATLGHPLQVLPEAAADSEARLTAGMYGAAWHALRIAALSRCCDVPVDGPRRPLHQRAQVRAAALALGLLALIGASEGVLYWQNRAAAAEKALLDRDAAKLDAAVKVVQEQIDRVKAAQELQKTRRAELQRQEARLTFFGEELPERARFVQALLAALENAVSDEVVIDRIEEVSPSARPPAPGRAAAATHNSAATPAAAALAGGFNLNGWALSERAAQQFAQALKEAMVPWNMTVRDISVTAGSGRLGLAGHAIRLRIVETPPPAAAETLPAAAGGRA